MLRFKLMGFEQPRQVSKREARTISSWVGTTLYSATVVFLVSAHVLNPDGYVSGVPALVLTLPWSMVLIRPVPEIPSLVLLIIAFGGVINSGILYWFIAAPVAGLERVVKIGTLAVIGLPLATLAWFLNTAEVDNLVRIARGGTSGGIFIAIDQNGLRMLSETIEMDANIPKLQAERGLVFIRNGTRARYLGQKFLIKGSRLVEPYSANSYDMARDGAIEVERIKIMEGPSKGLKGWVQPQSLQRLGGLYAL